MFLSVDPISYAGVGWLRCLWCAVRGHRYRQHGNLGSLHVSVCRRCGHGVISDRRAPARKPCAGCGDLIPVNGSPLCAGCNEETRLGKYR